MWGESRKINEKLQGGDIKMGTIGHSQLQCPSQHQLTTFHRWHHCENPTNSEAPSWTTETEQEDIRRVRGVSGYPLTATPFPEDTTASHPEGLPDCIFSSGGKKKGDGHSASPARWDASWETHLSLTSEGSLEESTELDHSESDRYGERERDWPRTNSQFLADYGPACRGTWTEIPRAELSQ